MDQHDDRPADRASANGVLFWSGPSELDQMPVLAIATGIERASKNGKTGGGMLQTWIIRADLPPTEAAKTGADESVCGDCRLRNGACYVRLHHGPRAVYAAYHRGAYPSVKDVGWSWADDRAIRFGAYSDPAAVPMHIWFRLAARASRWTGYSHQWRAAKIAPLRFLLMASVDSAEEAWTANALGWRSFRVRLPGEELLPFESQCPAAVESGRRTTCERCAQCDGARLIDLRRSYSVIVHGSGASAFKRSRLPVL